jgi:hypothetical protein
MEGVPFKNIHIHYQLASRNKPTCHTMKIKPSFKCLIHGTLRTNAWFVLSASASLPRKRHDQVSSTPCLD